MFSFACSCKLLFMWLEGGGSETEEIRDVRFYNRVLLRLRQLLNKVNLLLMCDVCFSVGMFARSVTCEKWVQYLSCWLWGVRISHNLWSHSLLPLEADLVSRWCGEVRALTRYSCALYTLSTISGTDVVYEMYVCMYVMTCAGTVFKSQHVGFRRIY